MITHRHVDVERDKAILLEFHTQVNFAVADEWIRSSSTYEQFRDRWLATSQPEEFLTSLVESLSDNRTIAELWEIKGEPAGYIWVRFTDIPEYEFTSAEIDDLAVSPQFQRQGLGSRMMSFAEEAVRTDGANALTVQTSWENSLARCLYKNLSLVNAKSATKSCSRRPSHRPSQDSQQLRIVVPSFA